MASLKKQSTRNSPQVAEAPNGTSVVPIWTNLNLPQLINPTQFGLVTLLSMMLAPVQLLPVPNPAPAPFEPITTLIAAKLFLGGSDDTNQKIAPLFPFSSSRSLCGCGAAARGRGPANESSSSSYQRKVGDEGEAACCDQGKTSSSERQESCSSATSLWLSQCTEEIAPCKLN